jgi:hypothetical protein
MNAGTWKLHCSVPGPGGDETLAEGTEAEVKAAALTLIRAAANKLDKNGEAALRCDLYLARPDGTHVGQAYGSGYFVPGAEPEWIEVDW